MLDAEATLLHKDFAKSKGWQAVGFSCAVCAVLVAVVICIGREALEVVMSMLGALIVLFGVSAGIDMKKFHKLLKEQN